MPQHSCGSQVTARGELVLPFHHGSRDQTEVVRSDSMCTLSHLTPTFTLFLYITIMFSGTLLGYYNLRCLP